MLLTERKAQKILSQPLRKRLSTPRVLTHTRALLWCGVEHVYGVDDHGEAPEAAWRDFANRSVGCQPRIRPSITGFTGAAPTFDTPARVRV